MVAAGLGCLWIVLVSIVAMVPYPRHRPYALACLLVFPVLLAAIWFDLGALWAALFLVGALSIYRYPVLYLLTVLCRRFGGGA